jgi:hypothetical protein
VVTPEDVGTFGQVVSLEASRQGLATAERVLVLGDGAAGIWNLAQEYFPQAVQMLDLWQATEHLWAAGRAGYGEGDARLAGWVAETNARLLAGEVQTLLTEWATVPVRDATAWASAQTSVRHQAHRMAYDQYRQAGSPLGSGAVERANRHVVGGAGQASGDALEAARAHRGAGLAGAAALPALGGLVAGTTAPSAPGRLTKATRTLPS